MNITQKILVTLVAIVLLGIVVTILYENAGAAPGDGIVGFILFGGFIAAIIFIWRSKPRRPVAYKPEVKSGEKEEKFDVPKKILELFGEKEEELDVQKKMLELFGEKRKNARSISNFLTGATARSMLGLDVKVESTNLKKGLYSEMLYSDNIDSIATTVKSIIQPLSSFGFTGTTDKTEAMSFFSILLGQRAQASMAMGQTRGNLLLDTGVNVYNGMYEECFVVDTDKYKLDLPLFVFTAMYLESPVKRESLKAADNILKKELFECIHDVCNKQFPLQVVFTKDESVDVMSKFYLFLQRRYLK